MEPSTSSIKCLEKLMGRKPTHRGWPKGEVWGQGGGLSSWYCFRANSFLRRLV